MCVRFLYCTNAECLNVVLYPQQNIKEKKIRQLIDSSVISDKPISLTT